MRHLKIIKLKAGALQFVVFIGVVIAILLAAFMTLSHVHSLFEKQSDLAVKTIKDVDFNLYKGIQSNTSISETTHNKKGSWGVFEKITSTSSINKNEFTKIALIGGTTKDRIALYLKENNQPLIVVGNTRIEGTSYIPKQGIKAGNIVGNSYYGTNLLYGIKKTSTNKIPKPIIDQPLEKLIKHTEKSIPLSLKSKINVYSNSFKNPTQLLYDNQTIYLNDGKLIGNIIVQSENAIIVENSAVLKDIILIAPKIEIKEGVKGTFQAFATQSITIGKKCQLDYPSALILSKKPISSNNIINRQISIADNTIFKGSIFLLGENVKKNRFKPQILIEKNSIVYGDIYCEATIELKGSVYGSVFTSGFISSEYGSVYLNHLFNGQIIASALPSEFAGLIYDDSKKEVMKWLY